MARSWSRLISLIFLPLTLSNPVSVIFGDESASQINYNGYRLLKVFGLDSEYKAQSLIVLESHPNVQFWTLPRVNRTTDILVSSTYYDSVVEYLSQMQLGSQIILQDVGAVVEAEKSNVAPTGSVLRWDAYYKYQDIVDFFSDRDNHGPYAEVTVTPIGQTREGRDIHSFYIKKKYSKIFPSTAVWIDAGFYGRDWASVSTATYIMQKIMYTRPDLLERFAFIFVPVVNVDGYEYTFTNDRFWGKNRANGTGYRNCRGVNLNRNFGVVYDKIQFDNAQVVDNQDDEDSNANENSIHFDIEIVQVRGSGVGHNPCSDYHFGPSPFSEPESLSLANALNDIQMDQTLYFSLHGYGQRWFVPAEKTENDYDALVNWAQVGARAMENTNGLRVQVETASEEESQGKSAVWARQKGEIKYAFSVDVRDDGTNYGFLMPSTQIVAAGEETFNSLLAVISQIPNGDID